MRLLDNDIRKVSSNLSNYTQTSKDEDKLDELDFEDKEMTSVLPVLELKEELRGSFGRSGSES